MEENSLVGEWEEGIRGEDHVRGGRWGSKAGPRMERADVEKGRVWRLVNNTMKVRLEETAQALPRFQAGRKFVNEVTADNLNAATIFACTRTFSSLSPPQTNDVLAPLSPRSRRRDPFLLCFLLSTLLQQQQQQQQALSSPRQREDTRGGIRRRVAFPG